MKDVVCVAAFIGKILCLVLFVTSLRPVPISAVEAQGKPVYCHTRRVAAQPCDLSEPAAGAHYGLRTSP